MAVSQFLPEARIISCASIILFAENSVVLPGHCHGDRACAGPGGIPAWPAAAFDLLLRSGRRRFRDDPAFDCQRDVFPVRIDGRLLRKHPRLRLFDHADACVADRRVRLPRAVDLYSFPG